MEGQEFLGKIGARIRKLRTLQGLTQEKLADKTKLHYKFIGNFETGKVNISMTNLLTIANALGISIVKLIDFEVPIEVEQVEPNKDKLLKIISEVPLPDLQKIVKIVDILR